MKKKILIGIIAATISAIVGFLLFYFVFDVPAKSAMCDMLGAEVGFCIAWFLMARIEQKKKVHA